VAGSPTEFLRSKANRHFSTFFDTFQPDACGSALLRNRAIHQFHHIHHFLRFFWYVSGCADRALDIYLHHRLSDGRAWVFVEVSGSNRRENLGRSSVIEKPDLEKMQEREENKGSGFGRIC